MITLFIRFHMKYPMEKIFISMIYFNKIKRTTFKQTIADLKPELALGYTAPFK